MKAKKVLVWLCAAAMLVSAAGCGSSAASTGSDAAGGQGVQEAEGTAKEDLPLAKYPEEVTVHLGGGMNPNAKIPEGMTYEDNTADTVTKAVNEAVKNIIKIINNCTKKDTTVTLEDVNIDGSRKNNAAMEVRGAGDTTLKLEGNNTLRSGEYAAGLEKDDDERQPTGKLTITAEDTSASLNAHGGDFAAGIGGGNGKSTSKLEIANGKIHAEGGLVGAGIGGGNGKNGEVTISGGDVTAQGGAYAAGIGGSGVGSGKVTIRNGKVQRTICPTWNSCSMISCMESSMYITEKHQSPKAIW